VEKGFGLFDMLFYCMPRNTAKGTDRYDKYYFAMFDGFETRATVKNSSVRSH
jgi:hypothetical protein